MKFIIPTQELNFLINRCLNIVGKKPAVPILSNLLIEAVNDELVITATDLTIGIRCFTEAKILEEGATTVPAMRFAQLIKELTSINVEISSGPNEIVEIVADSSKFKLLGMSRTDFPVLPNMLGATQIKMPQKQLKEMLYRTAFAVSKEDNRYVLTGVLLHIENREAICMGTDGKRLAKSRMSLDVDPEFKGDFVLPLKAVDELLKILEPTGESSLYLLHDKFGVETESAMLITKLLSGDYPDVNRIIPERSSMEVALHREELITLLRQVSLFTEEMNHSVKFTFSDGELGLSANTTDVGEGRVSMPVNYKGNKLEIAFNPSYFLDVLRHTNAENVTLGLTDPFNPGLITDGDSRVHSEIGSLFVLMPMRLS